MERGILFFVFLAFLHLSSAQAESYVEFFYVKRPVAFSTVNHEFIAAKTKNGQFVFGLLKNQADLDAFVAYQNGVRGKIKIRSLGIAKGVEADALLELAKRTTKDWRKIQRNCFTYLFFMGVTPLLGKPCKNAARELESLLAPKLQRL